MKPLSQLFWLPGSLSLFWLVTISPLQAQIAPDATLPTSSVVTTSDNTNIITGGTQAGSNLFHSFREFSIPAGTAYFNNAADIQNIISRVTGSSVSNINGLLQANGTANLFLLNPNGIIFGSNASLNIGGSFLASTASSLKFEDGNSFSTTNSQTTQPLLTVSVPIGLQFGRPTSSIQVQGATLQVPSGKTLALVGGDLTLVKGNLTAPGGRIELGSVTSSKPVQVGLTPIGKGWALSYEGVQDFQDIHLSQGSEASATGSGGGDIQVWGRRVTLTGGSQISNSTTGSNPGGTLAITASESVEINGTSSDGIPSGLFARVRREATGAGANLTIQTRQLKVLDGAEVSTSNFGLGKAGNLTVRAIESILVSGTNKFQVGSALAATVEPGATGDGGNLIIETRRLIVRDGAQVLTTTFGQRKGGNLTVQNAKEVELVGGTVADGEFFPSGLFSQAGSLRARVTGDGGNLSISTEKLILRDGAQINSTTFGTGNAGDLIVKASEIELVGAAFSPDGELLTDNRTGFPYASGLFAGTAPDSVGNGGTLTVETERLSLREGATVHSATYSQGDAGDLIIRAKDSVELVGTTADDRFLTGLSAFSGGIPGLIRGVPGAKGRGGDMTIETGELIVRDGAQIAVSSLNPTSEAKGAGNLRVKARSIHLDNQGKLTAETASGQGGNITLQDLDLLLLRRNSQISTTAGIAGAGGDGGNIDIDTKFLIAIPDENSDITANAFEGRGGFIRIAAQGVFGIEPRERLTPLSDITAFSQLNPELNGVVEINTPEVDPNRGLVELPSQPVNVEVAQGCQPASSQQASLEFFNTGRGGIAPNPYEPLSSSTLWEDVPPPTNASAATPSDRIVEAQGWIVDDKGTVTLVATMPSSGSHASCNWRSQN